MKLLKFEDGLLKLLNEFYKKQTGDEPIILNLATNKDILTSVIETCKQIP